MFPKRKAYLFVAIFYGILVCYLFCLFLFPKSSPAQVTNILQSVWLTCIFLALCFLFIAFTLSELIFFLYRRLRRMRWFRPKLGEILVSESYLTKEKLKEALSEQSLRIGEVLVRGGRITTQQLNEALDYQKKVSKNLGDILKELGHATEEDINWALSRMERRLGKILREKGYLTDHELHRLLLRQQYRSQ